MNCMVFKSYSLPEQQAQMLTQLRSFARTDLSPGAYSRLERLEEVISIFDTAALLDLVRDTRSGI
jgi:recyclin-1